MKEKKHYCYILKNSEETTKNKTYNGYTVNPKRRIRQHNQELVGGAMYTKKWGNKSWEMYVLIKGFPDSHTALQCEWRIKHPVGNKRPAKYNSPEGRVKSLNSIMMMDRWTSHCAYDVKDLNLEIWIAKEYQYHLHCIPENIKITAVDRIDLECM